MRILFILTLLLRFSVSYSQGDQGVYRHFAGMQMGGQNLVAINYEYSFISKEKLMLNAIMGWGLNEYADDTDPDDRPIYGIHMGLIGLAGISPVYLEGGIYPSPYFYKSNTFIHLNGWFGVRILPQKAGLSLSLGYTPRLSTLSGVPPNHFVNAVVGVKIGANF